jgi:serine protease DegQ
LALHILCGLNFLTLLRRFWLLFAQVATVCLAALFVVVTLRPDLLGRFTGKNNVVLVEESLSTVAGPKIASLADAARKATPSVVNVETSKAVRQRNPMLDDPVFRRFFPSLPEGETRRATSLGSGVIVSTDGFVLTNNHVIEDADDIQLVLSDGRRMHATVRGSDPESDLAVLKTDGKDLPAVTFGKLENVQVGDAVLAIGSPFGFGSSVTHGIVSALGRNQLHVNRFEDFIQTDAAVNPGNSGGALVDTGGNLIGINSVIYSQSGGSQGIGFAIPVTIARNVLEQIIRDGEVTRGWLGIEPQEITPELASALALPAADGVLIRAVLRSGPADHAGMLARDVVLEIDGKSTHDVSTLLAQIAALTPGTQVKLKVLREKKPVELEVTVGKRPKVHAS